GARLARGDGVGGGGGRAVRARASAEEGFAKIGLRCLIPPHPEYDEIKARRECRQSLYLICSSMYRWLLLAVTESNSYQKAKTGECGNRIHDLVHAKHALYQLS
ncbi:hypothetical protein THAOC_06549, partial [Thalassiosira oceanica]